MKILQTIWDFYVIGCVAFTSFFLLGLTRHLRKAVKAKEFVEEIRDQIKLVYSEHVGNAYYLYDHTDQFIAQGSTEEEMWAKAKSLFPKKEFITRGEKGEAVVVKDKNDL